MKLRTAKASAVAAWSFSSSATRPRQKSEEITSVGAKWRAAKLLLPLPEAPTSTTRLGSGRSILSVRPAHRLNTAIWVGGPTSGSSGPTGTRRTA